MTSRHAIAAALLAGAMIVAACGRGTPDPPDGSTTVTIATPDGETLTAIEVGQGGDVVVFSHGATGTKEGFYGLVAAFAADGWRAIAYDARGVGDSTGDRGPGREVDLRAVVDHASATGARRIVLVGASLGAALSIAMAGELDARAVVSLSAPADEFGAITAAEELRGTVPVFLAAAEGNDPFPAEARRLGEVLDETPTIVSGDGHGSGMLPGHPELVTAIVAFAGDAVDHNR
jgi:pimeloyl-ACP methyl ester carboxylesterase